MKTIQMTLDEKLIEEVDEAASRFGSTRSAFTRTALRHELESLKIREMEKKQIEGYAKYPVKSEEFDLWAAEQVWPD